MVEATFSKNVEASRRRDILAVLGVARHEKYLGLPTIIGRSKKTVFSCLKDRIWKKMQGWKEKLLSHSGKEVLIKAVAQAIPTYMMGLFKIPDGLREDIHSLLARFWWGANGTTRKMYWVSWEKLCLPKSLGGMGFRDLKVFNQALLAKQGWRLITNTSSLVYRVLKAKYFKHGDFISARRGHDPSYVWRSIWGAKALLLDGLKWRVGDGESIKVWDEAWLPGNNVTVVPTPNVESSADLLVADLIDREAGDWRLDSLSAHFTPADVNLIRSIPLSKRLPEDARYWWPTKDGVYTTKSGYWLGRLGHVSGWEQQIGDANVNVWKMVWGVKGPPKLCHFLWRACSGSLATLERLKERHVRENGVCELCHETQESICHAIFECSNVRQIWEPSPFQNVLLDAPKSSFRELFLWISSKLNKEELLSFCALAWASWSYRNSVVFNNPWRCVVSGAVGYLKLVGDYMKYNEAVGCVRATVLSSQSCWQPPAVSVVKINIDVAMLEGVGVGLGVAIRDDSGHLIAVGVKRCQGVFSVKLAEALAARWGMLTALSLGFSCVELEGDASSVIQAIKQRQGGRTPFDLVIEDIQALGNTLVSFNVNHVKRNGNVVAHYAARLIPPNGMDYVFLDSFPQGIIALAELDLV